MMDDPQTKECSPMLLEIRKAIQKHEENAKDPRRCSELQNNETFIAVGLRKAEAIIMKHELKD